MSERAQLPSLEHLSERDFEDVYEPSDDTWLLCDSILHDIDDLIRRAPVIASEIGPGSGAVSCYILQELIKRGSTCPFFIDCDINPAACLAATRTAASNGLVSLDTVNCDLLGPLSYRLAGRVDLLVFNPPYVPTDSEEVRVPGITAAWAGGIDGREVIDRVLPSIPALLSRPSGVMYLLLVEENR